MDEGRVEEAALGAVLGALVGDAAGAVLEFQGNVTPEDARRALTMPGGGALCVAPGQVTDDGELTMSLLAALVEASDGAGPNAPLGCAAVAYARWVASEPFDIGVTTRQSLGCGSAAMLLAHVSTEPLAGAGIADAMTRAAAARCTTSKANGSLMRATPLGVWGATRSEAETARLAGDDARLSHPNPSCVDATIAYALAIRALVRAPGDVAAAIDAARRHLADHGGEDGEVRAWLDEALADVRVPYAPQIGFVRIGFTHAFRHLARGTRFVDGLIETLAGGGDTDTNACIVGGLLGARWGLAAIPDDLRGAVTTCDTAEGDHPRPDALHPRRAGALVRALLHAGQENTAKKHQWLESTQ